MPLTRDTFIPSGAIKVCHKESDAVAYLYEHRLSGRPCALIFISDEVSPVYDASLGSEAAREDAIRNWFEARRRAMQIERAYGKDACATGDDPWNTTS